MEWQDFARRNKALAVRSAVLELTRTKWAGAKFRVSAHDTVMRGQYDGKPCIYCLYDGKPYAVVMLAQAGDGVYMRFRRVYLAPRTRRDSVMLSRIRAVADLAGCRVMFDKVVTFTFCACSSVAPSECAERCALTREVPYAGGIMYDLDTREIGFVSIISKGADDE